MPSALEKLKAAGITAMTDLEVDDLASDAAAGYLGPAGQETVDRLLVTLLEQKKAARIFETLETGNPSATDPNGLIMTFDGVQITFKSTDQSADRLAAHRLAATIFQALGYYGQSN